jgi:dihydroorotate dehydrogenase electron transfer subunit
MTERRVSLPRRAVVVSIQDENARVRTFELDLRLDAQPGQFVMVWLPGIDEKPFSLVGATPVTLTIARVGPFTQALFTLQVGDPLWIRGPLGTPFTLSTSTGRSRLLLVAGGYGVAPLYFLAHRARAAGWALSVVLGARSAEDLLFVDRFATLGVEVVVATGDGSSGERGTAADVAARLLELGGYETIYGCGPEAMLEAVERLARDRGLPAQLSYERIMRCGFGVCGTCAREGWLVCHDGPVMHISAVA